MNSACFSPNQSLIWIRTVYLENFFRNNLPKTHANPKGPKYTIFSDTICFVAVIETPFSKIRVVLIDFFYDVNCIILFVFYN